MLQDFTRKSLQLKILPGLAYASRRQVFRNQDFMRND